QRTRLACHTLRVRERPPTAIATEDLRVLDLYWSLAIGLQMLDVMQSCDFHARHLLLALRVGDRNHIAMSLATEAAYRSTSGRPDMRRIRELLSTAQALSEGAGRRQTRGSVAG